MTYQLAISLAAKEDLKSIYQFGLNNLGQAKTTNYVEYIKNHFLTLTEQPMLGVEQSEL